MVFCTVSHQFFFVCVLLVMVPGVADLACLLLWPIPFFPKKRSFEHAATTLPLSRKENKQPGMACLHVFFSCNLVAVDKEAGVFPEPVQIKWCAAVGIQIGAVFHPLKYMWLWRDPKASSDEPTSK